MTKAADMTAARELQLYAVNTGDLYRQRVTPILDNLARKVAAGTYDSILALKLWRYAADDAAKRYAAEFGGAFNVATREACAAMLADYYAEDVAERGATLKAERENRKRWPLSAIRAANEDAGFYFFSRDTLKFFGETMACFGVDYDGDKITVCRRKAGNKPHAPNSGRWTFNPETGDLRKAD